MKKFNGQKFVKWIFVLGAAVWAGYETLDEQKRDDEFEDMKERLEKLEAKEQ